MPSHVSPKSRSLFWPLLLALVSVFAVVRLAGLFGDLWLDEIWSLRMVQQIKSPAEILTVLKHDNNHPLNSLWLYATQPASADWVYRLLSWVTGSVAVLLAALIARRQFAASTAGDQHAADTAAVMAAVLMGGSYLLIHYSSEARGYAPMVMFGLLAIYALQHLNDRRWGWWALVYAVAALFGLLSHLAMVQVLLAGLVFSLIEIWRQHETWPRQTLRVLIWHAVPWAGAAAYYWFFVRKLEIGGGPDNVLWPVLGETSECLLGVPLGLGSLAVGLALGLTALGLIAMVRRGDWRLAAFFSLLIFVTPAVGMIFGRFTLVFPRYFLLSAAGALLVIGYGLTSLWLRRGPWREVVAGVLLLFVVGNAMQVARLARDGRGQYQAALRYIAERSQAADISLSSDHDFRNYALVDYYRAAGGGHTFNYYPSDQTPPWGVQWVLLHRLDGEAPPPEQIADLKGNRYVLERRYSHAVLSGWDWFVYRNVQLPPAS